MKSYRKKLWFFSVVLLSLIAASNVIAETIYVDSINGSDANTGTKGKPMQTIGRAAEIVNSKAEGGPTTIKIAPGIYNLDETVVFENERPYTETKRLIIQATILPDDPNWSPALMPEVLSTQDPRDPNELKKHTETSAFRIITSHVTIRGIKFLGNPLVNNWHACVERVGENLDDLVITQCMFAGDRDTLDIYSAALATGHRFVVDHCIFRNCHASTVYWDGFEGIGGKGCAMRHCIVDGSYISGVWTCQTAEDFEFHHNIITGCEYSWIRKEGDKQKYKIRNCIITDNKHYCGYGVASGATGQTGPEVTYDEENVIKEGKVILERNKKARNYLHVVEGSSGSNLGAGLFYKCSF